MLKYISVILPDFRYFKFRNLELPLGAFPKENKNLKGLNKTCLLLFLFLPLVMNGQDFLIEKDLRLDWTFYSDDAKQILPFLDDNSESPYAIHLNTSLDYGKGTYLRLEIPGKTSLFLGNKYIAHYPHKTTRLFSVDSLSSHLKQDELHLTLYKGTGFSKPPQSSIGFLHNTFDTSLDVNPIKLREIGTQDDFLKIIVLLVFTFFVILYTLFPSELMDFYSMTNLITFRFTDTYLMKYRSITKIQTLIIVFQGTMLASIMFISLHYYNNPLEDTFIKGFPPFLTWLTIVFATLGFMFLKYILISIVSILFGISERINFYFIEYLRMAMIFYSVIFIILAYVIINHFYSIHDLLNTLIIIVISFNFVRFIMIYFKFRSNISIKNLHLFSYLCSTELIPMIIGLNFFVK